MARVIITGTSSGCGKTTITIGLIAALKRRGITPSSLKCGPDYIDPMFHRRALGIESSNVDLFMMGRGGCISTINEWEELSDITIIEGVMGYYDGLAGISIESSTYDLSLKTNTPSILVVNSRGKSVSILAEIKGYLEYMDKSNIIGIILNNMSSSLYPDIKHIIENTFSIMCLGYLERDEALGLESRHLGLIRADEVKDIDNIIDSIATKVEKSIDIDRIMSIAGEAPSLPNIEMNINRIEEVNIAVAMDEGFNFYYRENINALKTLGANIIYFSPIHDDYLPTNIHGLYIGGGYPELYLEKLSSNASIRQDILSHLKGGLPCIAECGGFMYLNRSIKGENGEDYKMVGYLGGKCFRRDRLTRFGYISVTGDNSYIYKGEEIRGHEFHYYDCTVNGEDLLASKPLRKRNYKLGRLDNRLFAGFHHTHFYSNLDFPRRFITKAKEYKLSIGG